MIRSIYRDTLSTLLSSVDWLNSTEQADDQPSFYLDRCDGAYVVSAALPGVRKDQVSVKVSSGVLSIEVDASGDGIKRPSFRGKLRKSYRLSDDVDTKSISASMTDGILRVELSVIHRGSESLEVKVS